MKNLRFRKVIVAAFVLGAAALQAGCELVAGVDRDEIPSPGAADASPDRTVGSGGASGSGGADGTGGDDGSAGGTGGGSTGGSAGDASPDVTAEVGPTNEAGPDA